MSPVATQHRGPSHSDFLAPVLRTVWVPDLVFGGHCPPCGSPFAQSAVRPRSAGDCSCSWLLVPLPARCPHAGRPSRCCGIIYKGFPSWVVLVVSCSIILSLPRRQENNSFLFWSKVSLVACHMETYMRVCVRVRVCHVCARMCGLCVCVCVCLCVCAHTVTPLRFKSKGGGRAVEAEQVDTHTGLWKDRPSSRCHPLWPVTLPSCLALGSTCPDSDRRGDKRGWPGQTVLGPLRGSPLWDHGFEATNQRERGTVSSLLCSRRPDSRLPRTTTTPRAFGT